MKLIGFFIEGYYIFLMEVGMAIFAAILMAFALYYSSNIDNLPIIIMTLIQLDGNLIEVCINWIHY